MSHPLQVSATAGKADFSRPVNVSALKGKSVLVTGGASGLGAGFVRGFAEAGYDRPPCAPDVQTSRVNSGRETLTRRYGRAYVTIADIQAELGQKYAQELKERGYHVTFVHTDVLNWASQVGAFKAAIDHSPSKGVDIVVPTAGVAARVFVDPSDEPASLDKDPPEPTFNAININLTGVTYTTKLALHYFPLKRSDGSINQGGKSIILISSLAGYVELPWAVDYQASKYGVRGLFKALRNNVPAMGVRMNLIAPWFIQTPMTMELAPMLEERGVALAKTETAVEAVLRCAADDSISGRAIAVAASGLIDLRDDTEGLDAGIEVERFLSGEGKGYLQAFLDVHPAAQSKSRSS